MAYFFLTKKAKTPKSRIVLNESLLNNLRPGSEKQISRRSGIVKTMERARAMRAEGNSFAKIAAELGVGLQWAYKCAGDILGGEPKETAATVVRRGAHNGGCSTTSGMIAISMPRIPALHGVPA